MHQIKKFVHQRGETEERGEEKKNNGGGTAGLGREEAGCDCGVAGRGAVMVNEGRAARPSGKGRRWEDCRCAGEGLQLQRKGGGCVGA